jgi:hypothetical protein
MLRHMLHDKVCSSQRTHAVTEGESIGLFDFRYLLCSFFALQISSEGGRGNGDDSGGSSRLALRLMTCDVKPG